MHNGAFGHFKLQTFWIQPGFRKNALDIFHQPGVQMPWRNIDADRERLVALDRIDPVPAEYSLMKDEISIGRGEENDVVIPHASVSRHHARLMRRDGGFELMDLNDEIRKRASQTARVIDLHGRAATPGLIDTHCHFDASDELYAINLAAVKSVAEAVELPSEVS